MSRLIDGDALKTAIEDLYETTSDGIVKFGIEKAMELIDNAPTVELQSCVAKVTLSEEQLNEIVARVTERAISERLLGDL